MEEEFIEINILKLIATLVSLGILLFLRFTLLKVIRRVADKFERFQSRTAIVIRYTNVFSFFLFLIFLLLIWGINFKQIGLFVSSIFAVIGVAFFAQWSILSNMTSGVIMFFSFPYKIGDFIKIHDGDHSIFGHIEEIRSFHVVLRTLDREEVTFPNSLMLQKAVSILDEEHIEKLIQLKAKKEQQKSEEEKESDN